MSTLGRSTTEFFRLSKSGDGVSREHIIAILGVECDWVFGHVKKSRESRVKSRKPEKEKLGSVGAVSAGKMMKSKSQMGG